METIDDLSSAADEYDITAAMIGDNPDTITDVTLAGDRMLLGVAAYSMFCLWILVIVQRRTKERYHQRIIDSEKSTLIRCTSSENIRTGIDNEDHGIIMNDLETDDKSTAANRNLSKLDTAKTGETDSDTSSVTCDFVEDADEEHGGQWIELVSLVMKRMNSAATYRGTEDSAVPEANESGTRQQNVVAKGCIGETKRLWGSHSLIHLPTFDHETIKLLKLTKSLTATAAIGPAIDLLLTAVIASQMGDGAVEAFLTSKMIINLSSFLCDGMDGAQHTHVSKSIGDKDFYRAGRIVYVTTLIKIIIFFILLPLWFFFMDDIFVSIFGFDASVARIGVEYTRVYGIAYILAAIRKTYATLLDVDDHEDFNSLINALKGAALLIASVALSCFVEMELYMIGLLELLFGFVFFVIHILYPLRKKWIEPYWDGMVTPWANADIDTTKKLVSDGSIVSIGLTVAHFEVSASGCKCLGMFRSTVLLSWTNVILFHASLSCNLFLISGKFFPSSQHLQELAKLLHGF